MNRRSLIPLLLAALMVPIALAQENPTNQPSGDRGGDRSRDRGGDRGGPGGGREQFMNRIKEQMGVTNDEEWKVIQAKLEPVMQKRMETMGGFGFRGRGGDDNDSGRQRSAVEQASRDLRQLLENKDASEDQIKEKLTAYREAREKARTELQSAQKELKDILMPRQEAALVLYGMLE